jgi:hypothetical protein
LGGYLVALGGIEVAAAEKGYAGGLKYAIDLAKAFLDVGYEDQRASAEDYVCIIIGEGHFLCVCKDE